MLKKVSKKEQIKSTKNFQKHLVDGPESMSLKSRISFGRKFIIKIEEPKDNETIGFLLVDDMNQILDTILLEPMIRISDTDSQEFIMDNEIACLYVK